MIFCFLTSNDPSNSDHNIRVLRRGQWLPVRRTIHAPARQVSTHPLTLFSTTSHAFALANHHIRYTTLYSSTNRCRTERPAPVFLHLLVRLYCTLPYTKGETT
jgi:hypothetical protein